MPPPEKIETQDTETQAEWQQRRSREVRKQIEAFADTADLSKELIEMDGFKAMVIGDFAVSDAPAELVRKWGKFIDYIKNQGVYNQCFLIAKTAYTREAAAGMLGTDVRKESLKEGFIRHMNHCVNFVQLGNLVVGIDFTAAKNLDYNQGEFDILLLAAPDVEKLQTYLSELYGGEWNKVDPTSIRGDY